MAKEYLKSRKIEYEEFDITSDSDKAQEMVNKSGQMGVPVIEIGDKIVIGFDRPKIDAALAIK
ncbi:NrdH-redoxin [Candidatus Saccharibacteria bacterium]|nr:NrdH-redoxin [Candidatus Saccharibacteria bacterium]